MTCLACLSVEEQTWCDCWSLFDWLRCSSIWGVSCMTNAISSVWILAGGDAWKNCVLKKSVCSVMFTHRVRVHHMWLNLMIICWQWASRVLVYVHASDPYYHEYQMLCDWLTDTVAIVKHDLVYVYHHFNGECANKLQHILYFWSHVLCFWFYYI